MTADERKGQVTAVGEEPAADEAVEVVATTARGMRSAFPHAGLSETALKVIACAIMAIDHTAAALVTGPAYWPMRYLGRIAFPIFCLTIAEGARHTHDWRRYLARLLVMGAVSELPFDLALFGTPVYTGHQNVMWELALALVAVRACMWAQGHVEGRALRVVFDVAATLGLGCVAEALGLDYGILGVPIVVLLWALRERFPVVGSVVPVLPLGLANELPWVLGACPLIACYDGTRGRTRHPWLFYLFYPGHLALLALLRWLL